MKETILETERLIIRKPDKKDFVALQEGVDNINIAKHIGPMPHPYSLDMVKDYYGKQIEKWEEPKPKDLLFILELKCEEKAIGALGLHGINYQEKTAETGSWLNEKYWRKGYMSEAKIAVNNFAFNDLKLQKLLSPIFKGNIASRKTQEKMGYELVETVKDGVKCLATGITHDSCKYELTKEKWQKALKNL